MSSVRKAWFLKDARNRGVASEAGEWCPPPPPPGSRFEVAANLGINLGSEINIL